jgi:hypothetical protein
VGARGAAHRRPLEQLDTPDQGAPPDTRSAHTPATPGEEAADHGFVEYVPASEVVPGRGRAVCTAKTGPYQRQVERFLGLRPDGRQSAADCVAIRAFQRKADIHPDIGFAGRVTWGRISLLRALRDPNAAGRCPVRRGRVACVDLSRQLMWVQEGRGPGRLPARVVFGPVPVRSGRAGHPTRTGWHRVYWRRKDHWSPQYSAPMPFSQYFDAGQGFHGVYGNVYGPPGSYGCVNLRWRDAAGLWRVLRAGDRVYVWGRRPGT